MLLVATDPRFAEHDPGRGHPERPARLAAVLDGLGSGDRDAIRPLEPRRATRDELERVHTTEYLERLEVFCARGGGPLDPDTSVSPASYDVALLAAGAGLAAVEALEHGEGDAAFCAVRPPGHHAVPSRAMGFCLVNNVAVTAAALRDRGQRVLIVDWDAHHGNGTQDIFWADPDVMYVSMHEWPLYPGTGRLDEVGAGPGTGTTVNFPFPPGTTGDVYLAAVDDVVAPLAQRFAPDWLLVSAGYDAHRADPLTGLGLTAGDYADLTSRLLGLVPPRRTIAFLEGGYDLDALRASVAATVSALLGTPDHPEGPTCGGPGRPVVRAAGDLHEVGAGA
ncbi:MAG: histone deacetylase [Acidimicrobiia bacterium]|nr:MAG: histone deacetylase [Acidimicrobiia bacterium]